MSRGQALSLKAQLELESSLCSLKISRVDPEHTKARLVLARLQPYFTQCILKHELASFFSIAQKCVLNLAYQRQG